MRGKYSLFSFGDEVLVVLDGQADVVTTHKITTDGNNVIIMDTFCPTNIGKDFDDVYKSKLFSV